MPPTASASSKTNHSGITTTLKRRPPSEEGCGKRAANKKPRETNVTSLGERAIVLDLETCGANDGVGRILEVAAVELLDEGTRIGETLHFRCNPGYSSDAEMVPAAMAKHKLTIKVLQDEMRFEEQYDRLKDFLGDCPIICHGTVRGESTPFDEAVLNSECERVGKPKLLCDGRAVINSNDIAKVVMPKFMPQETWGGHRRFYSLFIFVLGATGVKMDMAKAHSATYDAQMLAEAVKESYNLYVVVSSLNYSASRSERP